MNKFFLEFYNEELEPKGMIPDTDVSNDPFSSKDQNDSSWNFDASAMIADQSFWPRRNFDSAPETKRSNPGLPSLLTDSSNELMKETCKKVNPMKHEMPVIPQLTAMEWRKISVILKDLIFKSQYANMIAFCDDMEAYQFQLENKAQVTFSNITDCNGDLITVKMPHFIFLMLASDRNMAITEYHNLSYVPNWPTAVREINAVIDCLNQKG